MLLLLPILLIIVIGLGAVALTTKQIPVTAEIQAKIDAFIKKLREILHLDDINITVHDDDSTSNKS